MRMLTRDIAGMQRSIHDLNLTLREFDDPANVKEC